eukprot:3105772-Rhodomonas_salina.3
MSAPPCTQNRFRSRCHHASAPTVATLSLPVRVSLHPPPRHPARARPPARPRPTEPVPSAQPGRLSVTHL